MFPTAMVKDIDSVLSASTNNVSSSSDISECPKVIGSESVCAKDFCSDTGLRPWAFLVGASIIEGFMWGFMTSFGVFQRYYENHTAFQDESNIQVIGTLATGISYFGTPLVAWLTINHPHHRRKMMLGGWIICILALLASSFATNIWHLIITQGLLYGIGFLVVYYPVLSMLNEWFVLKRGRAYGILFGSASIYGLGIPFLIQWLLNQYGYSTTLRVFAVGMLVIVGPIIPLLRPRLPVELQQAQQCFYIHPRDTQALWNVIFSSFSFSNILQGLAFFLPGIYIPAYARDLGLTDSQGTLALSLMNLCQVFGQIILGRASDTYDAHILMSVSTFSSAIVTLLLWGLGKRIQTLLAFAMLYGAFAGGYSVLYSRFTTSLSNDGSTILWLYSIFEFQRGVGNISSGLLARVLVGKAADLSAYGIAKYERLVLFIGIGMLLGSIGGANQLFRFMFTRK
ncbi:hypothetical protein IFR05_016446 [Cadophora sp. M221]|nr:hypothetical protein IFR05_016446 [Cadophora sp. M221]